MRLPRPHLILEICVLCCAQAFGQTPVPIPPAALDLASKALQSLAGGTALSDITMVGTATYIAGSDQEMGSATLIALGNQQSRVTLNLTGAQKLEVRSGNAGTWLAEDGSVHAMGSPNTYLDAAWFYPALSLAALGRDSSLTATLVGQETHGGVPVYHLLLYRLAQTKNANAISLIQRVSAMHLYLDAALLRPVALDFNVHPDTDEATDIPAEIQFGGYQSFNGVWAPTRIQKYLQNSLVLDLTLSNVALNSGVSASTFILPSVVAGGAQ